MQMNLMIRITGSFLSLISFATSVISDASISSLPVCRQGEKKKGGVNGKSFKKMFRLHHRQVEVDVIMAGQGN